MYTVKFTTAYKKSYEPWMARRYQRQSADACMDDLLPVLKH